MPSSSPKRAKVWVTRLETDEQSAHKLAGAVSEQLDTQRSAVSLVDNGRGGWQVAIHFDGPPDKSTVQSLVSAAAGPAAAKRLRFERVTTKDWVKESLADLKPVEAGRFLIHGAHDRVGVPPNRIGIEIEAALAFGTGHHGSTHGCLLALARLLKRGGPLRISAYGARLTDCRSGRALAESSIPAPAPACWRLPPPWKTAGRRWRVTSIRRACG